jgi:hypothetical protein
MKTPEFFYFGVFLCQIFKLKFFEGKDEVQRLYKENLNNSQIRVLELYFMIIKTNFNNIRIHNKLY